MGNDYENLLSFTYYFMTRSIKIVKLNANYAYFSLKKVNIPHLLTFSAISMSLAYYLTGSFEKINSFNFFFKGNVMSY